VIAKPLAGQDLSEGRKIMQSRTDPRTIAVLALGVASLPACQRELVVAGGVDGSGSAGTFRDVTPSPSTCDCASSPRLTPLYCAQELPEDSTAVFTTTGGGIAAFELCRNPLFDCDVLYWDGSSSRLIPNRLAMSLSASGRELLTGTPLDGELIRIDGSAQSLPVEVMNVIGSLNAAGDVVLGSVQDASGDHLARLNIATGEVELLLAELAGVDHAVATPDASVIAGSRHVENETVSQPFRWRAERTELGLPGVPEGIGSIPEAVSADGTAIAGETVSEGPDGRVYHHFYWSEAGGYVGLSESSGRGGSWLSADGRVMLGTLGLASGDPSYDDPDDNSAFRWTERIGVAPIAPFPTIAAGMSDDGNVILAYGPEAYQQRDRWLYTDTYVWDSVSGIRSLEDFSITALGERGIDTTGWFLAQGLKLSGDGTVLFGRGLCGSTQALYRLVL
jgi:hypothetical protein